MKASLIPDKILGYDTLTSERNFYIQFNRHNISKAQDCSGWKLTFATEGNIIHEHWSKLQPIITKHNIQMFKLCKPDTDIQAGKPLVVYLTNNEVKNPTAVCNFVHEFENTLKKFKAPTIALSEDAGVLPLKNAHFTYYTFDKIDPTQPYDPNNYFKACAERTKKIPPENIFVDMDVSKLHPERTTTKILSASTSPSLPGTSSSEGLKRSRSSCSLTGSQEGNDKHMRYQTKREGGAGQGL